MTNFSQFRLPSKPLKCAELLDSLLTGKFAKKPLDEKVPYDIKQVWTSFKFAFSSIYLDNRNIQEIWTHG